MSERTMRPGGRPDPDERAQDGPTTRSGRDREREAEIASGQVGVGTAPGQPPSRGTGARGRDIPARSGRVDAEAATLGGRGGVSGATAEGEPSVNVGGPQGDRPGQGVADMPPAPEGEKPQDRVGFFGDASGRRGTAAEGEAMVEDLGGGVRSTADAARESGEDESD